MTDTTTRLPRLMTIRAAATYLGVSTRTVRRMIDRDQLGAHRIGRLIRIEETNLASLLQGNPKHVTACLQ
jgi:excisionase family DNA binding protein